MSSVSGIHNISTSQQSNSEDQVDPRKDILVLGCFKRGRLDKPFKVTKTDFRAKLGFDYQSHYYMVVEDLLNNGAPYVWIQRVIAP